MTYGGAEAFLREAKGASKGVGTRGRIRCDDMFFARAAARAGAGIALLPSFLAEPEISAGSLIAVLPKWQLRQARSGSCTRPPATFRPR